MYKITLQYISPNCYYVLSRIFQSHGSPKIRLEEKEQEEVTHENSEEHGQGQ